MSFRSQCSLKGYVEEQDFDPIGTEFLNLLPIHPLTQCYPTGGAFTIRRGAAS